MGERTTGATDAQIEALEAHSEAKLAYALGETGATEAQIKASHLRRIQSRDWTETTLRAYDDVWMTEARANARYLVPPDHRIIGPEDIVALRRVLQAYKAATDALNILWEGTANASDAHDDRRLAALIGDDDG
jgi:hypothetical protein